MRILLATIGFSLIVSSAHAQVATPPSPSQNELVTGLRSDDTRVRQMAVAQSLQIQPERRSPALWAALAGEFRREVAHYVAQQNEKALPHDSAGEGRGEYVGDLIQAMVGNTDPSIIPQLIAIANTGKMAETTLAEFGEAAAPAILKALSETSSATQEWGLAEALRLMLVLPSVRAPVRPSTRERIGQIAIDRISTAQQPMIVGVYASLGLTALPDRAPQIQEAIADEALGRRGMNAAQRRLVQVVASNGPQRMPLRVPNGR